MQPDCFLTESSKSQPTASIAQSNKQRIGTCLYQEWCKPLLISCEAAFGYEQVAKRIANIRLTLQNYSLTAFQSISLKMCEARFFSAFPALRQPLLKQTDTAQTDLQPLPGSSHRAPSPAFHFVPPQPCGQFTAAAPGNP